MIAILKRATLFFAFLPLLLSAQRASTSSSVDLYNDLQKLNFLGSALYVAAHPDDENTRLISYLSNAVHARTAYLSLTRGDGGQNLIGPELRELLGVLRTQELLAARNVDGGEQFFSRAVDFGYSKHPDETLNIWEKDEVLADVVRIIRQFRPDVIVNRFDHRTPGTTHGHHTASAMLSTEAFALTGDSNAYPEQLETLDTWQPKRIFHNTSWWFYGSEERFLEAMKERDLVQLDVGVYYPERGLSNNEIASMASSQHLCQGFGRPLRRGSEGEFLELIEGMPLSGNDLFEGIDTSWGRIAGGSAVGAILYPIAENFNFANPAAHLPKLLEAYQKLSGLEPGFWRDRKLIELKNLIVGTAGLYLEASSQESTGVPGATARVSIELINRSEAAVKLLGITGNSGMQVDTTLNLTQNKRHVLPVTLNIDKDQQLTGPYWLRDAATLGMYNVPEEGLIGKPETPAAFSVDLNIEIEGNSMHINLPVIHRYAEPDKGERYKQFDIVPPVTAGFTETVVIFPNELAQPVQVSLKAQAAGQQGTLKLNIPEGWSVNPAQYNFSLATAGEEKDFTFEVLPPNNASEGSIRPEIQIEGEIYDRELITIAYDHVPTQLVLMPAQVRVVRLDVQKKGQHIGYIMGAGDAVPESLEAIGYTVHRLEVDDISAEALQGMDAVVLGIRAYNVLDDLPFKNPVLLEYVAQGGTMITQYNTSGRGPRDFSSLSPYALQLSRDRVSDENAKVSLLAGDHPVLNFPNKITEADFEGWVQERGLYFPDSWDSQFTPILGMNDPGESRKDGSLLVAPYGEGHYIYTGLSFFRELPAGVPGAFKLFTNMLSIGAEEPKEDREIKG
ncbi:GlcNAc-PI de-N-acetylase [Robiginitalea myxolifaciens]|uniref:GlcNAc-PI de-N-acetylase n=1 Tax=Robiginitalea myxolifaciens TaxID=400055 RepID=A0A1I6H1B6_9FLAO|nr:PIG-L family deacetylase [Robiginitalea myxolifaciens]SFR48121.1 GlcNAc-PI de-N-acetylase [Robiginitalea myxolifaciens]